MKRILLPVLLLLAGAAAPERVEAQPVLSRALPMAARIGETTEITLHGDKLEEPLSVWASFPGTVEVIRELDEAGNPKPEQDPITLPPPGAAPTWRLRVTVPAETAVGVGGIVVGTKAGVSEPLWVMLDDLPSVADQSDNHAPETAQEISPPVAVDGKSQGPRFDYYRFKATAGQRVAIEVVARRLGTPLDPVLRLLDAAGNELAYAEDDPALGADCRLAHTFAAEGEYLVEVRDIQYRGNIFYRLRIGDFPLVNTPVPLGGPKGASTEFRFSGPDGEAAAPVAAVIPGDAREQVDLSAKLPGGTSSAMAAAVVSDLPNVVETEPNDAADAAQEVALPGAINGAVQQPGDVDHYRFTAAKGEKYVIRGLSRSLSSPAYLFLRLFDEKGAKLAEAGAGNEVESLAFAVPADGTYRLAVAELLGAGGPGYTYRIEIEPDRPRFSLSLKNDKNLPHKFLTHGDGGFVLDVVADRKGYDGPIRLSLSAPQEGFQLRREIIPAGAKETRLIVLTPADLAEGRLITLRIRGEAVEGDAAAELTTAELLKTKRPELPAVPAWMDSLIHAAVAPPLEPFFALSLQEEMVAFDREKSEAKFVLKLQRTNKDFKQDPSVFVEGLPPGVSASVKKEGKDAEERFEITLAGKEIPAGEHAFEFIGFGDRAGRGLKIVIPAKLKVE